MRYPEYVRLAVVIGVLALATTAHGKPARLDDFERFDPPPEPCASGKTIERISACFAKQGTPSVVFASDLLNVIRVDKRGAVDQGHLHVFVKGDREWTRVHQLGVSTAMEVLSVAPIVMSYARGVRIDIGITTRTNVSVDQLTSERGVLRRVMTTVCTPQDFGCRSMMTACETYLDGKAYFAFRAELVEKPSASIRLRGNRNAAQGVCTPPAAFMVNE